jgi:hypothetical protein
MIYTHVLNRGAGCGAEPGRPNAHSMTWLAALEPKHNGIGCRTQAAHPRR